MQILKEGYSVCSVQTLKKHGAASSHCLQMERQGHVERQNEDFHGQPNPNGGNRAPRSSQGIPQIAPPDPGSCPKFNALRNRQPVDVVTNLYVWVPVLLLLCLTFGIL